MAIIKGSELKAMEAGQLQQRLSELESEVLREKGLGRTMGKPTNPGKLKDLKRLVARIKTLLHEKGVKG